MKIELTTKQLILIGFLVILVLIFTFLYNWRNPSLEQDDASRKIRVDDYSRFFTVSNAANSYINFLASKNVDALMKILSEDYQRENRVTEQNIIEHLGALEGYFYSFQARNMYQYRLSNYMIRYYIHGHLREEILDSWEPYVDYYLILTLDTRNFTFSITPYDGATFRSVN